MVIVCTVPVSADSVLYRTTCPGLISPPSRNKILHSSRLAEREITQQGKKTDLHREPGLTRHHEQTTMLKSSLAEDRDVNETGCEVMDAFQVRFPLQVKPFQKEALRFSRKERIFPETLETHRYDVAVIGGGIIGTALFRKLTQQGLSVLLLDKSDPNRPTRTNTHLAHTNIRYFANGDFKLIKDAREQVYRLLQDAKHLVRRIPLLIPFYEGEGHPWWLVKPFLWQYDRYLKRFPGAYDLLPKHQWVSREQLLNEFPHWQSQGLKGAYRIYEGQILDPQRVGTEYVQAILNDPESDPSRNTAINHAKVYEVTETPENVRVSFQDLLSSDGKTYTVEAKYVLHATGPQLDQSLGNSEVPLKIGPQSGPHLFVKNTPGIREGLYTYAQDGRPFYILPYPYLPNAKDPAPSLLIGTKDDRVHPDQPLEVTDTDITYLLDSTNRRLNGVQLTRDDLEETLIGVRPLEASSKKPGQVSRQSIIKPPEPGRRQGYASGKWTMHQVVAQQMIAGLMAQADFNGKRPNLTTSSVLWGAEGIEGTMEAYIATQTPTAMKQYHMQDNESVAYVIGRYGSQYGRILDYTRTDSSLKARLSPESPVIEAQILYAIRHEQAETVMDVLLNSLQLDRQNLSSKGWIEAARRTAHWLSVEKELTPQEAQGNCSGGGIGN